MQMILGLETNDLLYLRAKGSGGYDDAATKNRTCTYIVPSFVSPGMKDFFASEEWNNRNAGDKLLYKQPMQVWISPSTNWVEKNSMQN